MPDSPPESFGSESLQSDSPALTIEMEERSPSSSGTETVSELASPTDDLTCIEKGSALADELCNRLRLFESLQVNGRSVPSPQEDLTDTDTQTIDSPKPDTSLLSPDACPRLVRSSSLKTGKTPPGTPNRKKIVRFADALGLDLEAVRHFVEDEDALIPQSAFADLKVPSKEKITLPWAALPGQAVTCHFVPQFPQPAADPHFLEKVRLNKVCLENLLVNDLRLTAVVRVLNLGFHKDVIARYTTTEWAVYTDLSAEYVPQSCDGFSDKFTFQLHLPHLCSGQRLIFAIRYTANGQEFWDNHDGSNYVLRVQSKSSEDLQVENGTGPRWLHHFM